MINLFLKKSSLIAFLIFCSVTFSYAQTDTVFTNTQKIACVVKEVSPDVVKYSNPGEDMLNVLYTNSINKIVFKSGRVQTFENKTYKPVLSVRDFGSVTISTLESDIKGFSKLGELSSKAKGTTAYASEEHVKQRAYNKLKMQAALMGANVILVTNQHIQGNNYSYYSSNSTETNLTGVAYATKLPDYDKFLSFINNRKDFNTVMVYNLGRNDTEYSADAGGETFTIDSITNNDGIAIIKGHLKGENDIDTFQLANFDDKTFSVFYKKKTTYYNVMIQPKL
jgi:Domain of unknown function (DUF4156)